MAGLPRVPITAAAAAQLRRTQRPWLYKREILAAPAAATGTEPALQTVDAPSSGGELVRFVPAGQPHSTVGVGFLNVHARTLWGRVLSFGETAAIPDRAWYAHRVRSALILRQRVYRNNYYRLIHAEADGLPGLTVDRYGHILIAHSDVAGVHRAWPDISAALLKELPDCDTLVLRSSQKPTAEGLAPRPPLVVAGSLPGDGVAVVPELGVPFLVPLLAGQKTGWYYDQTANRAMVGAWIHPGDRVLDVCCYLGGFGLVAAARDAGHVTLVDSSATALKFAEQTAVAAGLKDRVTFVKALATEALMSLQAAGDRFDVIILDPPPFARSAESLPEALRGYRQLVKRCIALLRHGGILFFSTCSHAVTQEDLVQLLGSVVADAGRASRLLAQVGAGPDHPVLLSLPETGYLRGILAQID